MYTGSCLCGEIAINVLGDITDIIHCHCSLCRKASGTAFATNGFVKKADLEILKGQNFLASFESRPGKRRHFCKQCACPVFSSNEQDTNRVRLRLGFLDSVIVERPISHNFVTSKANWEYINAELPQYETYEPNRNK